jgi:SAM-dependent methyltransferase
VNVGAGVGSYEPEDRAVVAVEPSAVMIEQRTADAARAVQASVERLPFANGSFDAAMAVLTLQHWSDVTAGIAEMVRVVRHRVVLVTFDPERVKEQWIARDYLPEALTYQLPTFPAMEQLLDALPDAAVQPILIPRDCTDRMFLTLWARPEEHLDPRVRAATSTWHVVPRSAARRAIDRLRHDLASGEWDEHYGYLRRMEEFDVGLRLLRAELA